MSERVPLIGAHHGDFDVQGAAGEKLMKTASSLIPVLYCTCWNGSPAMTRRVDHTFRLFVIVARYRAEALITVL
jgi:hypothetical protein